MRSIYHILSFEWKRLWRSNIMKLLFLVIISSGLYGIYFGKFEIEKQNARIAEVNNFERQQMDSLKTWIKLDTTIRANFGKYQKAANPLGAGRSRHFTYFIPNNASPTAGLCLGQRDLFPVFYRFNMSDLSRQMNTTQLANPFRLLTGNFDLSYVFIFLFPLFILALFYNLYAEDKEGNTLHLLKAQSSSVTGVFLGRAALKLFIVWGLILFLLSLGFMIHKISLVDHFELFLQWLLLLFGYALFWIILMGLIISLRKGSSMSAILGIGIWLLFTFVFPSILNLWVNAKKPFPNRS